MRSAAVKIRRITELHTYIDTLKNLGAVGESMAQHLYASARKYDIRTTQKSWPKWVSNNGPFAYKAAIISKLSIAPRDLNAPTLPNPNFS